MRRQTSVKLFVLGIVILSLALSSDQPGMHVNGAPQLMQPSNMGVVPGPVPGPGPVQGPVGPPGSRHPFVFAFFSIRHLAQNVAQQLADYCTSICELSCF